MKGLNSPVEKIGPQIGFKIQRPANLAVFFLKRHFKNDNKMLKINKQKSKYDKNNKVDMVRLIPNKIKFKL